MIRIEEIELKNIRNVENGIIKIGNYQKNKESNIIGIYGQNGSGKTVLVEAFELVKDIISGNGIKNKYEKLIKLGEKECSVRIEFFIEVGEEDFLFEYTVTIEEFIDNDFKGLLENYKIKKESVRIKLLKNERPSYRLACSFNSNDFEKTLPLNTKDTILKNTVDKVDFKVNYKMMYLKGLSFIFNDNGFRNYLKKDVKIEKNMQQFLILMKNYFMKDINIVFNNHMSNIFSNEGISFKYKKQYYASKRKDSTHIILNLNEGKTDFSFLTANVLNKVEYEKLNILISSINTVLKTIIPGLALRVEKGGEELLEKGETGYTVELKSIRNNDELPLKFESEGILKIISILSMLIEVYNNPGFCLIIDELDSGIFEYLLGELIGVLGDFGKGQLVFTSHNLRPLEMLHKNSIYFTTSNTKNKYITFSKVNKNNNMRNLYYRAIQLGGEAEELYKETSRSDINMAFLKTGVHDVEQ